ncbi:AAA family ATPase [Candidatus Woesearchaeota archaeon]|nr:AAA family ATPase [Candidatus Woesearchaeota archaeon]
MDQQKYQQLMNKINEAVKFENEDIEKARQMYLQISEELLNEAKTDKINRIDFLDMANKYYEKAQTLENKNEEKKSNIKFKDICGLQDLKDEIKLKIIEPLKYPEVFKRFNKKIGGGIIMYGPPGCGKTLMAEAAANEAGVKFFNLNAANLRSKYVGESEKNISNIFKEIRQNAPCIVFFDEFENLGEDRNTGTKYSRNEVSQLLQEMDGFGNKDKQVLFIAATNAPWFIDIALRREGRFGDSIFVGHPDLQARKGIFIQNLIKKPISGNVNFNYLAEKTNYFSGAEIVSVCENATDKVLKEFIKNKKLRQISMEDLETAILNKKPLASKWYDNAVRVLRNTGDNEFLEVIEKNYNHNLIVA